MSRFASPTMRRMRGFSLIELMVSMALSLVLLAGALSILYSSKVSYSENERVARLQEAGRTVVELILRDARSAGYVGCARPLRPEKYVNGLTASASVLWNLRVPLAGYETSPGAGAWTPALNPLNAPLAAPDSDVIVIRTTRQGQPVFRTNAPVTDPTLPISVDRATNATVPAGTPMVIGDCTGASAFVASGVTAVTPTTATISHIAGGTPGNATVSLGRAFKLLGAQVVPVQTIIYYVRNNAAGLPALWQRVGSAAPQLLIEGVENIQITYGEDTTGDQLADAYVTADAVGNWNNVISFSIAILVRSEDENGLDVDGRTYNLLGTNVGPFNDRRQRSVFTTTVTLRNVAT
ncbi:MAG: PilW family protein [Pseudomonadota bacterium]